MAILGTSLQFEIRQDLHPLNVCCIDCSLQVVSWAFNGPSMCHYANSGENFIHLDYSFTKFYVSLLMWKLLVIPCVSFVNDRNLIPLWSKVLSILNDQFNYLNHNKGFLNSFVRRNYSSIEKNQVGWQDTFPIKFNNPFDPEIW